MADSLGLWGDLAPPKQDPAQAAAPGRQVSARALLGKKSTTNPCIPAFGPGPSGTKCGDCKFFLRHLYHTVELRKCYVRGLSHGDATDHRVRWPTCAQYVKYEEGMDVDRETLQAEAKEIRTKLPQ